MPFGELRRLVGKCVARSAGRRGEDGARAGNPAIGIELTIWSAAAAMRHRSSGARMRRRVPGGAEGQAPVPRTRSHRRLGSFPEREAGHAQWVPHVRLSRVSRCTGDGLGADGRCGARRGARLRRQSRAEWCRRHRHLPVQEQALKRRLVGHFNYFGVNGNTRSLARVVYATVLWRKWLRRRSQRTRLTWERFAGTLPASPAAGCRAE